MISLTTMTVFLEAMASKRSTTMSSTPTTPIRVPSAPGRLASSPYTTPTHMASSRMDSSSPASAYAAPTTPAHMASPRMDYLSPASAHSPPKSPYVAPSPSAQASTLSRSVSSPNPATATPKRVVPADDFDLRFAGAGHARTDSVSDETALGGDFARNERFDAKSEEVEDAAEHDEALKQKGKGLFSFGSNKPKVHPLFSLPLLPSSLLPPSRPLSPSKYLFYCTETQVKSMVAGCLFCTYCKKNPCYGLLIY